jgi:hypothetical protein
MIRRVIVISFLIHLTLISLFSQSTVGLKVGPNYSKYLEKSHGFSESHPQIGISANLTFNLSYGKRFASCLDLGYQSFNNNSKGGGGSAHSPWTQDGEYTTRYISLSFQQRIVLSKDYDIGFFTGISIMQLIHARFIGNLKSWSYMYGDPAKDHLMIDKYVDENMTDEIKGRYLYFLLGFDYKFSINERIKITFGTMSFLPFPTLKNREYGSSPDYTKNIGGSVIMGLSYSLNKKEK